MNRPPNLPHVNAADGEDEPTRAEPTIVPDLASDDVPESAVDDFEATRVDGPNPKVLAELMPPLPREGS
jgi:hypothetical protein